MACARDLARIVNKILGVLPAAQTERLRANGTIEELQHLIEELPLNDAGTTVVNVGRGTAPQAMFYVQHANSHETGILVEGYEAIARLRGWKESSARSQISARRGTLEFRVGDDEFWITRLSRTEMVEMLVAGRKVTEVPVHRPQDLLRTLIPGYTPDPPGTHRMPGGQKVRF